jgi:hypothetical protein
LICNALGMLVVENMPLPTNEVSVLSTTITRCSLRCLIVYRIPPMVDVAIFS